MKHKHLSINERQEISILLQKGYSCRDIGRVLNRSHTSIGREIQHNGGNSKYDPNEAQKRARMCRLSSKYQGMKIESQPILRKYIIDRLMQHWTPEEIAGRLKKKDISFPYISAKSIYKWLYSSRGQLYCYFLAKKRFYPIKRSERISKHCPIPNRTSIEKRPIEANTRAEFGHYEEDTMVSGNRHINKAAIAVLCERKARFTRLLKMRNLKQRHHVSIQQKITQGLKMRTITYDNGPENCGHETVAKLLNIQTFFCHPYSSWEKGTIENTIGRIRRFIPKSSNIINYSEDDIEKIEYWLNHTPRKCLNFKTPYEIMIENNCFKFSIPSGAIKG